MKFSNCSVKIIMNETGATRNINVSDGIDPSLITLIKTITT